MRPARRLIVTCDDLGYHPTVNEAIVEILARGLVRSASLMTAAPHFDDAVQRLRAAGIDRVGVHLTISSEYPRLPIHPVSARHEVASLVDTDGRFHADVARQRPQLVGEQVELEFRRQIDRAHRAGLRLTHLDGHMFCYEAEVAGPRILGVATALARSYDLPLRRRAATGPAQPRVHMLWDRGAGDDQREAHYAEFLAAYRGPLTELIIHPGRDPGAMRQFSRTGGRRLADYRFFTSDRFHGLVRAHGICIVGWGDA